MPGRPKEFSREEVLASAMDIFWSKGYEAASVRDIEKETGIGRQSIYNEFGDKKSLFLESVAHYDRTVTQSFIDVIRSEGSPTENIRKWLEMLVKASKRQGCLLTNAVMNVTSGDAVLVEAAGNGLKRLEKTLLGAVENAIDRGELPPTTDAPTMASCLLGTGQGILVMGKLGHSSSKLRRVITQSLVAFSG